jgi:hypothetical protein
LSVGPGIDRGNEELGGERSIMLTDELSSDMVSPLSSVDV